MQPLVNLSWVFPAIRERFCVGLQILRRGRYLCFNAYELDYSSNGSLQKKCPWMVCRTLVSAPAIQGFLLNHRIDRGYFCPLLFLSLSRLFSLLATNTQIKIQIVHTAPPMTPIINASNMIRKLNKITLRAENIFRWIKIKPYLWNVTFVAK